MRKSDIKHALILITGILFITSLFAQVIVIDAGHGVQSDCNNCDRPDEEVLTVMAIALKLEDTIQAHCNWTVHLTRVSNACGQCPSLTQRESMSNSWGADRFLSIHANAGGGTGTETFWCNNSVSGNAVAQAFATEIQAQMVSYGQWTNRRVVEDNTYLGFHLGVLDNNNAIGCLNEVGFFDNSSDLVKLESTTWQGQFARAYYIALQNDMNTFCSGGVTPPVNDACVNAITLTPNTSCANVQGTLAGATSGGLAKPSCDGFATPALKDVWYRFQATAATHNMQVTSTPDFDAVVTLYSSCAASELGCADDGGVGITETINATSLVVGTTYYIRVYDYGSVDPTTPIFNICVTGQPQPVLPDLDVTAGSVLPVTVIAGNSVTIDYTIINTTNGTISVSTETGYYLVPTAQGCPTAIPSNNFNGGTLTVAEISDGAEDESHTVTIPASTAAGSYYLVVATDQLNDIGESNENNNTFCIGLTVTALSSAAITGNIHTETGISVNTITVNTTCNGTPFVTGPDGDYAFALTPGSVCTITPFKNNDVLSANGISTLDILLIQRHLLGMQPLPTPYKIIAADVDASGSVSTLDIIRIRQLILGRTAYFPGDRLWRFVLDDFLFANPQIPFPHDTARYYPTISTTDNEDFIAIKLGDVSDSWNPNMAKAEWNTGVAAAFFIDSLVAAPSTQVVVLVRVVDFDSLIAIQGSVQFDPSVLTFLSLSSFGLPGMSAANFGTTQVSGGKLSFTWDDATLNGVSIVDSSSIFSILFNVVGTIGQFSAINFTNTPTALEVVDVNFNTVSTIYLNGMVTIDDDSPVSAAAVIGSVKIFPNPNSGIFRMEIPVKSPSLIQVTVFNILGHKILETQPEIVTVNYTRNFDLTLSPAGIYFVRVMVEEDNFSRLIEKVDDVR